MLCDYFHIKGFLGMYSNQYTIFLLEMIIKGIYSRRNYKILIIQSNRIEQSAISRAKDSTNCSIKMLNAEIL